MEITAYERYSEIRDSLGLTDFKVAKLAGIPQSCIYDWKYGKSTPSANKMKNIATVLEIPVDEIVDHYTRKRRG